MADLEPGKTTPCAGKRTWEAPGIEMARDVRDIVGGGEGKLSIVAEDMGDAPRKPKGLA